MSLLKGLNFDYSGQESTVLTAEIGNGSVTVKVLNIAGFSADDYILINPKTETAEILLISSGTGTDTLTVSASSFKHSPGEKVYRLPFNQMKFYKASSADGSYSAISGATVDMMYQDNWTRFDYGSGSSADYYKRTFYNENSGAESDISLADYWQTSDEELYITPQELRSLMQFTENDFPRGSDMVEQIKLAQRKIGLDVSSSNPDVLFIATFLLSKAYVLKALASRSLSKGYITVNVEGRSITKAYQELVLESENVMQEYYTFINTQLTSEVSMTTYIGDVVDADTLQDIKDRLYGINNAISQQSNSYWGFRTRREL